MSAKTNLRLEEYKILKEESKIFTNQTFRDFQLFIGLITLFFALVNSKDTSSLKFPSYAFMQLAVFVFITIQFNRSIYLLVVRNHLARLEIEMRNASDTFDIFEWESVVVPSEIAPIKSYSSVSQMAIVVIYFLVFLILCCKSAQYAYSIKPGDLLFPIWVYFFVLVPSEFAFVVYSVWNLLTQRSQIDM